MTKSRLPKTLFSFMWHCLKQHEYKLPTLIYCTLALLAGFWSPFNSILLKKVINILSEDQIHSINNISKIALPASLIVINFIVFDNFTWRGITYIKYRFLPTILNSADNFLLNHILQHSHQFFQERMAGTLSKQFFHLIDGIEKIISSSACHILRAISLLLISFVFAYQVNYIFFGVLFSWSICFFGISLFMSKKLTDLSENQANTESVLGGQIIDSLTNSFSVNLFARRKSEIIRRVCALKNYRTAYQKKEMHTLIMHSIQGGLIAAMMAFSTFFLVYLYKKNLVTIGDFALILGLSMETGHIMWFTMYEIDEFNKVVGRCKQSLDSLMIPIEIEDSVDAKILNCKHGHITFDKVKFHYKGTATLFQNKSIEIQAGQKVGLVGYSGGGKSTFVNLILRLYDVIDGAILIDGQDIRDVMQDSLRNNIALIPQDPSLFHRSLMENIRYGRIDATDKEVMEAAKKAHAHEFIERLPQGYNSLVGERGIKLSGGQRQRIAIARAILKNAPILILDEATSQLDSVTENLIQESLLELMNRGLNANQEISTVVQKKEKNQNSSLKIFSKSQGNIGNIQSNIGGDEIKSSYNAPHESRTTIVVAHRLSTLLIMDRILVFDKGKIVEDGTHAELLAKGGLYKALWNAQVGGFLYDKKQEDEDE